MGVRSSRFSALATKSATSAAPKEFKLLVWNIQGLRKDFLEERTLATVQIINDLKPNAVMFQELIPGTYYTFKQKLSPTYSPVSPCEFKEAEPRYFTGIFVENEMFGSFKTELIRFKESIQGRDMLLVKANFTDCGITLITSHLESTSNRLTERKNQLKILCQTMLQQPEQNTVIYGGDTNLRDEEYDSVVENGDFDEERVYDVWKALGSAEDVRYTWDPINNDNENIPVNFRKVKRFDRVFVRSATKQGSCSYSPKSMMLVGKERLPCGMFCSDHWGVFVEFSLSSSA